MNTCATITACCLKDLIGMYLGLFMGAGEEGGKGSEMSTTIDLSPESSLSPGRSTSGDRPRDQHGTS